MDIRFLSTFLEVVNTRHFGKAAENLYLTQSAVSARIKLLEEYFQTSLFIRHRNSIQLTPAGEKLLPYAHQLTDTIKQAKRELQLESGEYVVFGATQLASELVFTSTLNRIHQSYPDWSVKAEVLTLESLSRQLHERTIDLAFSSEPLKSEEVLSFEVLKVPLALFSVNREGDSPSSGELVSIAWNGRIRDALHQKLPHLKEPRLQTNSLRLAINSLQEEGGFAVLPTAYAEKMMPTAKLRCVSVIEELNARVFVNSMKTIKRPGLTQLLDNLKTSALD